MIISSSDLISGINMEDSGGYFMKSLYINDNFGRRSGIERRRSLMPWNGRDRRGGKERRIDPERRSGVERRTMTEDLFGIYLGARDKRGGSDRRNFMIVSTE